MLKLSRPTVTTAALVAEFTVTITVSLAVTAWATFNPHLAGLRPYLYMIPIGVAAVMSYIFNNFQHGRFEGSPTDLLGRWLWRSGWIVAFDLLAWWNTPEIASQITNRFWIIAVATVFVTGLVLNDFYWLAMCLRDRIRSRTETAAQMWKRFFSA